MDRNTLIRAVALHMDEITPDETLTIQVDGGDNNPLYGLIDGLVDSCVLELFSVVPYWRLPQTAFSSNDVKVENVGDRKVIRLKLGDTFLRVAEINCDKFQRPITEVVQEQSPEGKRQHNRFLMGREARPVGVLSHGVWTTTVVNNGESETVSEDCREIDCYSVSSTPSEIVAFYIATPSGIPTTGDNAVEGVVPPVLIPALEWLVAARTFGHVAMPTMRPFVNRMHRIF